MTCHSFHAETPRKWPKINTTGHVSKIGDIPKNQKRNESFGKSNPYKPIAEIVLNTSHMKKKLITFHYTGWLMGILIMVYFNPCIPG